MLDTKTYTVCRRKVKLFSYQLMNTKYNSTCTHIYQGKTDEE